MGPFGAEAAQTWEHRGLCGRPQHGNGHPRGPPVPGGRATPVPHRRTAYYGALCGWNAPFHADTREARLPLRRSDSAPAPFRTPARAARGPKSGVGHGQGVQISPWKGREMGQPPPPGPRRGLSEVLSEDRPSAPPAPSRPLVPTAPSPPTATAPRGRGPAPRLRPLLGAGPIPAPPRAVPSPPSPLRPALSLPSGPRHSLSADGSDGSPPGGQRAPCVWRGER